MVTEIVMKGNGKMIKLMGKVNILMLMEHIIKVTGKRIGSMDMGWNFGLMVLPMKENIEMGKNMELES